MTEQRARRIADAAIGLILIALATKTLLELTGEGFGGNNAGDLFFIPVETLGLSLYAWIGRLIVSRQPRNTIGWLLLAIPLVAALTLANGEYATRALVIDPGSLPFGLFSAWIDRWAIVAALVMFIPIFLVFPGGRLPSRGWRWVMVATVGSSVLTILAFAFTPGRLTGAFADLTTVHVTNPLGIESAGHPIKILTGIGGFSILFCAVAAGVSIIERFRRATPEVRQQIRLLLLVAVTFFVIFVLAAVNGDRVAFLSNMLFALMFITLAVGIPVACGIAILKYRLYDLDVVIRKAVVFGLLAVFITAVYAGVVGGVGLLVSSTSNTVASFAAATILAIAFQPARDRARHFADRVVYGTRATPYEVLAEFSDRMSETYSTEDVLPRMAQILADGTGAETARVWLRIGNELRPAVSTNGTASAAVALQAGSLPEIAGEHAVEVRHQGELLGALSVVMPANDPMNPAKDKLVRDLAAQAGLVLRNVRLIEELRASRQRLVAAQDEERRKLERNIHDGAQQQLVALTVKLKLLGQLASRDPEKTTALAEQLRVEATEALEDLRDLARGIYPPLLADKGLVAALESQARKSAVPVTITADGIGRFDQDAEAAVYFCCLEALQNVAKYANATRATVSLRKGEGALTFEVTDDGAGFDLAETDYGTGLQGMADRLDALGGTLEVRSAPSERTTVAGRLAVAEELSEPGRVSSSTPSPRKGHLRSGS